MNKLRLILIPFSWIYGLIISLRNGLYDVGILKSYSIPNKSICIGNLSTGGTGKSPHVDLIVSHFLKKSNNVSTLSRGYGRSTSGLKEVFTDSKAKDVGDEPLMYKLRHKDKIKVIVAEKRKEGVEYIQQTYPENEIIILDDAFQHRAVKAGINILITDYANLFTDDYLLPAGNLRESKRGKKRADSIIVSKCPTIDEEEKNRIKRKLNFHSDNVFFSRITYDGLVGFNSEIKTTAKNILLVTGIGNPTPLVEHLKREHTVEHLRFKDHHLYSQKDIAQIHEKFDTFASRDKIIVTTEKDFMRIKDFAEVMDLSERWFYQPITTKIDEQQKFNQLLDGYIESI
jgi:tetraacyldisaccharide 4'-kinase